MYFYFINLVDVCYIHSMLNAACVGNDDCMCNQFVSPFSHVIVDAHKESITMCIITKVCETWDRNQME